MTPVRITRWLMTTLALLSLSAWTAACSTPGPPARPVEKTAVAASANQTPLRVAISTDMPPLIYRQNNLVTGLEAELARGLADYLGRPLQFVETDWQDLIPSLLEGRTDIIMSGLSITEMRKMRIAFCDPYSRTGQMAVVRRGDTQRFRGGYYAIAQTPTIGAVENTTGAGLVRSKYEKARKQFFKTAAEGIDALRQGTIDFMIHDAAVVMVLAAQYESELEPVFSLLTEEYLAWGVRRDDEALRQAANAYMADLKGDGRLEALVKRWMPF